MKHALLFLITFTLPFGTTTFASSTIDEAAKLAAQVYIKEQLKEELRVFLNAHPEIVFSKNAQIGTKSIQFLSRALAVYDFINAKTDKQRFWAGITFIAPDPTTALVILAVQIGDAMLDIKHQKDLAKINNRTIKIYEETIKIISRYAITDFNRQLRWIKDFEAVTEKISSIEKSLTNNPLYLNLTQSSVPQKFHERDVEKAISDILQLNYQLLNLKRSQLMLKHVDPSLLGAESNLLDNSQKLVESYLPFQANVSKIKVVLTKFYALALVDARREYNGNILADQRFMADLYMTCTKETMKAESNRDPQFYEECLANFPQMRSL